MIKTKQKILFLFLVCFSIYCALAIGQAWDEEFLVNQGKITLNYLLFTKIFTYTDISDLL